ncbi:MAG: hypothetical protein EOP18_08135, partial [Rhizobiaceae bacterium]
MAAKTSRDIRDSGHKDQPLRIHIQNGPPEPDTLVLERPRLDKALRSRDALKGLEYSISVDDGGDQLPAELDAEIIITLAKIDVAKARQVAPDLKWVQTTFAGVEGMLEELPRGFSITNASGVHAEKGGEFILAAALMLAYQIPQFATDKDDKAWQPLFGPVLNTYRVT